MESRKRSKVSPESIVREIKRKIRRKFTAEEKIRLVPEGLRGEQAIRISAVKRASIPQCTTNGANHSWRLAEASLTAIPFP